MVCHVFMGRRSSHSGTYIVMWCDEMCCDVMSCDVFLLIDGPIAMCLQQSMCLFMLSKATSRIPLGSFRLLMVLWLRVAFWVCDWVAPS